MTTKTLDRALQRVSGLLEDHTGHTLEIAYCEREGMHCWVLRDGCGDQSGDPFYEWADVLDFVADVTGEDPEESGTLDSERSEEEA